MNQLSLSGSPVETSTRTIYALLLSGGVLGVAYLVGAHISPFAAMAVGLAALVIPYWNLERSLMFFLAGTLLWPYTMAWQVGPFAWGPSRGLYVLFVSTWLIAAVRGQVKLKRTPLDLAILLFVAAILTSFVINSIAMNSDQFNDATKTFGFKSIEWFLLFYLVAAIPKDWKQVRGFFKWMIIIVSAIALVGIFEYLTGFRFFEWLRHYLPGGEAMRSNLHEAGLENRAGALFRGGIVRIVSTTISPHEVGTLMATTTPLVLYFIAYSKTWAKKMIWFIPFTLICAALFLSVTRGAILATGIGVTCLSLLSKNVLLRGGLVVMATIVTLAFLFIPSIPDAVLSVSTPDVLPQEGGIQSRTEDWPQAAQLLYGHELNGIGLGLVSGKLLDYGGKVARSFRYTDNYYLSVITETGYLGGGFLLVMWGTIIYSFSRKKQLDGDLGYELRDFRIAILSAAVVFMVMCFTFDALGFMAITKFFWVIVGLGFALTRIERSMAAKMNDI